MIRTLTTLLALAVAVHGQDQAASDNENDFEKELCKDRNAGEWFRLVATEASDECRNVIQCTSSGLQAIRCPPGLYFDIEAQTCNWKNQVHNCNTKNQERKAKPLLATDEPLCQENYLACADSVCIPRKEFCDGEENCADGSDESQCDINNDPNRAPVCNPEICRIPECFCSSDGTAVPGGLDPQSIPQLCVLGFPSSTIEDLETVIIDQLRLPKTLGKFDADDPDRV
ncbi:unnamed protein product [Cyprideis torosa]|uniref:Uncharacterized protein n=1 Tax=Cyprideis torosa TaxID=163714 RepID=A0A7R8W9D9_9CRUS|nr:unnamed protein product [Cyprideis torosa]CAG0888418.1 unnamed protein product [Cyprideis torosa]